MAEALVPCLITRDGTEHSDPCTCRLAMPPGARLIRTDGLLSQEWREKHCEAGDAALRDAQEIADREDGDTLILSAAAQTFAAIAQAHYAAANVRARPS